jgi:hypothetical protein
MSNKLAESGTQMLEKYNWGNKKYYFRVSLLFMLTSKRDYAYGVNPKYCKGYGSITSNFPRFSHL